MSYIHLEFPGRQLGSTKKPIGTVLYETHRSKRYARCKNVTAAFYNSGNHLYYLWDGSWPRQYEDWEQPLLWLQYPKSYKDRIQGIELVHCTVQHLGHKWVTRNGGSVARINVFTKNGNAFEIYLVPGRLYYIVHIGNGAETLFRTNPPITMPKSLLSGRFDK